MHRWPFLGFHPFCFHTWGELPAGSIFLFFSRYLFLIFHPPDSQLTSLAATTLIDGKMIHYLKLDTVNHQAEAATAYFERE